MQRNRMACTKLLINASYKDDDAIAESSRNKIMYGMMSTQLQRM